MNKPAIANRNQVKFREVDKMTRLSLSKLKVEVNDDTLVKVSICKVD